MPSTGIITQFNGGELSPLLAGRVDVSKYVAGCKTMEGFMPTTQGPALSIPGTRFVAEVKDSADQTWLMRFEFSVDQAYILEFGDSYIRFYTDRGQVQYLGAPYEIVSPYTSAMLTSADGSCALRAVQTADVMYLLHADVAPQKLVRLGATNWTISEAAFREPPFGASNSTTTTIYSSATTGAVTLTASAATFTSDMVGRYIMLEEKDVRQTPMWEVGKAVLLNDKRRSLGNNYQALAAGTTGSVRPSHYEGTATDGDPGVEWQYLDSGSGYAQITGFTSTTVVSATVIKQLPDGAVTVGNATTNWALGLWGGSAGYPTCGTFFRERLVLAGGQNMAFSVAGDFENFATEIEGSTEGDAGFVRQIVTDRVNSIQWLSPGGVLLVGTTGEEHAIAESSTGEAFGPSNAQTKPQSTYGSNGVNPVRAGDSTLFVQKAARKIRAMGFRYETDGYRSPDITEYADHITSSGVVDMAYQQEPWPIVWAVRADGQIAGCLFNAEQSETPQAAAGWFRRRIEGGTVEAVRCIPSPDTSRDDLWMIIRLTVNGATKRYICYMEAHATEDTAQEDWFYVDLGATYDGAPATTISGLDYLEGKAVDVLADGANHPQRTVVAGEIELQVSASKVQVGLPIPGQLEPMPFNFGQNEGTAQGKITRVSKVTARVWNSAGGKWGAATDDLKEMDKRSASTPMGTPTPAFTGDIESDGWPDDYNRGSSVIIERNKPMPLNIVSLMPAVSARG